MDNYLRNFICLVLIWGFLVSCSNSLTPPITSDEAINYPPEITNGKDIQNSGNIHQLWAYNLFYYDAERDQLEAIPDRYVLTHWNILNWLEKSPCTNCLSITKFTDSGFGTKLADVKIKHPFLSANLTGFDVRGIVLFNGSRTLPSSGLTMPDMDLGDGELLNEDGYTTLYNAETFGSGPGGLQGYLKGKLATNKAPNAKLNGFKRFVSDDPSNTRNAFFAGDEITVTFELKMPSSSFVFGYAVDASWAPATVKPVKDPIADFPPEANCPEPWKISYSDFPIGNGFTPQGGKVTLLIDVYDWSGKDSHGPPVVEFPDLFDGLKEATWDSDYQNFTRYSITLENSNLAGVGQYSGIIIVSDNENDSAPEWLDLTAYYKFYMLVYPFENTPPVAAAKAEPTVQDVGFPVHFTDNGSVDPDGGDITLFEWDWDNDGIFDETGSDVYHEWDSEGVYYVQFRVTDDEFSTDTLDDPIHIVISANPLNPIAQAAAEPNPQQAGSYMHIFDNGSFDPDGGSIVSYEWDYGADGTYEDAGEEIWFMLDSPGTKLMQLRVTDDEGATDLLDTPLLLEFVGGKPPIALVQINPLSLDECGEIIITDDGSYDPDGGAIQKYEIDLNNDGYFEIQCGGAFSTVMSEPGVFQVQYRVTDDEGMTDTLDEPITVTVNNSLPVAVMQPAQKYYTVNDSITLNGSPSYDGLCGSANIVKWEWDIQNDGIFDLNGKIQTTSYSNPGIYNIQLRVTDNEGSIDTLDTPFQVSVDPKLSMVDETPPWLRGGTSAIATYGNYAYFALEMEGVAIMDISNPLNPVYVSWFEPSLGSTLDVCISGNYLFVSESNFGLWIYSLANPTAPSFVKQVPTQSFAFETAVQGDYAYVADGYAGLQVIDINPINSASIVRTVDIGGYTSDVAVYGNYAFLSVGGALKIVDVSVPEIANLVKTLTVSDSLMDIQAGPGYVYTSNWYQGFKIIDVSPVEFASVVKTLSGGGYSNSVCLSGNYAYFTDSESGINIVNITDPPNSSIINWLDNAEPFDSPKVMAISGEVLIAAWFDVFLYDVVPQASAWLTAYIPSTTYSSALEYKNGYVYSVKESKSVFQVIDVDPPALSHFVASVPIVDNANNYDYGLDFWGDYAFVVNGDIGLTVINISNPLIPSVAAYIQTMGNARAIDIDNGYAYVADHNAGLTILDIDPLISAAIVKNVPIAGNANDVSVVNGYAYIATQDNGIFIVDVTPISSAFVVGHTFNGIPCSDLGIQDGFAYVGAYNRMLVADIEPPNEAHSISDFTTNAIYDIVIRNGYAYTASEFLGIGIYDIEPASMTSLVDSFHPWGDGAPKAICKSDDHIYLAEGSFGLRIVRMW